MENSNDPKNAEKKLSPTAKQQIREQLKNRIAQLSDDELDQTAGGTTTPVIDTVTATGTIPATFANC